MTKHHIITATLAILIPVAFFVGRLTIQDNPAATMADSETSSVNATPPYGPDFSQPTPYLGLAYGESGCEPSNTADDYVCIYKLAHDTLAEADTLADDLIAKPLPKDSNMSAEYLSVLPENIRKAQKARDSYLDAYCDLDEMLIFGGSGMDLEREACRYYYAEQYLNLLKKLQLNFK